MSAKACGVALIAALVLLALIHPLAVDGFHILGRPIR